MVGCDAVRVDTPVDLSERSAAVLYELFVLGRVALIDFLCVMCIGGCGCGGGVVFVNVRSCRCWRAAVRHQQGQLLQMGNLSEMVPVKLGGGLGMEPALRTLNPFIFFPSK